MPQHSLSALLLSSETSRRAYASQLRRECPNALILSARDCQHARALLQQFGPVDVALCEAQPNPERLAFLQQARRGRKFRSLLLLAGNPAIERGMRHWAQLRGIPLIDRLADYSPALGMLDADVVAEPLSAEDLRLGLWHREFQAYVQPKFDLRSGAVRAVEVLARWQHPFRGLLAPASFIPLMSREGLLDDLLFDLLEQGLACQLELHRQGHDLAFAFNLSLGQASDAALIQRLVERLRQHPLPLSQLTFEITEDGPASAGATCVENLIQLSLLGVRLSIDDFGTQHSSLLRLCQLPFDEIKLAAEFTRQIADSEHYRSVARHVLALAGELGMQLVVEGIETEAQRHCLVDMGVRTGQGYLRAEPFRAEHLADWLQQKARGTGFATV